MGRTPIHRAARRPAFYLTLAFALVTGLSLQGCAAFFEWQKDTGPGEERLYSVPFQKVWNASLQAVDELGLELWDVNKRENLILAKGRSSPSSYGENMAIYVVEVDKVSTRVKAHSKRKWHSNLLAVNWEEPFLDRLEVLIGVAKPKAEPKEEVKEAPPEQ